MRAMDPVTPVLMFSLESSGSNHPRKVLQPGVKLYLSKTSDFVSLVQSIDRLLQS